MWNGFSEWWCKTMHSKAMWPIHGRYVCPNCHREYPVVWEAASPPVDPIPARPPQPPRRTEAVLDDWGRRLSWSAKLLFHRAAGMKRSDTM